MDRVENGSPCQYSCLEKFHGQRSLAGYSPRSHSLTPLNENTHSQNRDVLSKAHFIPHLVSSQVVEGGERQAAPTWREDPSLRSGPKGQQVWSFHFSL